MPGAAKLAATRRNITSKLTGQLHQGSEAKDLDLMTCGWLGKRLPPQGMVRSRTARWAARPRGIADVPVSGRKACPRVPLHLHSSAKITRRTTTRKGVIGQAPRVALHFTPTSEAWLNMVEVFFS